MRGLFVGMSVVDALYLLPEFPPPDVKSVAEEYALHAGGPATNAAITFAALGGDATLLTPVGPSPLGSVITSELSRYGVTLWDACADANFVPVLAAIFSSRATGGRNVLTATPRHPPVYADILPENLSGFDIVLMDGHHMPLCQQTAERAARSGVRVVLDGGSWKPGTAELLRFVDTAVCSANFSLPSELPLPDVLTGLQSLGVPRAAVSRGPHTILYAENSTRGEIFVPLSDAVDTLGAGDILHGAFSFHYASGLPFPDALAHAARLASLSCRFFGTRAWIDAPQQA